VTWTDHRLPHGRTRLANDGSRPEIRGGQFVGFVIIEFNGLYICIYIYSYDYIIYGFNKPTVMPI